MTTSDADSSISLEGFAKKRAHALGNGGPHANPHTHLVVNLVAVWVPERRTQTHRLLHLPSLHLERHNIGIPQSAGREGQESGCSPHPVARRLHRTMPWTSTCEADSSVSGETFNIAAIVSAPFHVASLLLGTDCHDRLAEREESTAFHTLSKEDVIGTCRKRRHLTPTGQSQRRALP